MVRLIVGSTHPVTPFEEIGCMVVQRDHVVDPPESLFQHPASRVKDRCPPVLLFWAASAGASKPAGCKRPAGPSCRCGFRRFDQKGLAPPPDRVSIHDRTHALLSDTLATLTRVSVRSGALRR